MIAISNPAESMGVCLLCRLCSGLCDELIAHTEESYCVCVCLIVCDLEISKRGGLGPRRAVAPQKMKELPCICEIVVCWGRAGSVYVVLYCFENREGFYLDSSRCDIL
jgi:hypothetical protein